MERSRRLPHRVFMSKCNRCHTFLTTQSERSGLFCERCKISDGNSIFGGLQRWAFAALCSSCLVWVLFMLGSSEDHSVSQKMTTTSSEGGGSSSSEQAISGRVQSDQRMVTPITDRAEPPTISVQNELTVTVENTSPVKASIVAGSESCAEAQTVLPNIPTNSSKSDVGETSRYAVYVIAEGDSMYAIAEKFLPDGAFLHEFTLLVMRENNIENVEALRVGLELKIPLDLNKED